MLGSLFKPTIGPRIEGSEVSLRLPEPSDHGAWVALRQESRAFLEPWEPRWARDEFERTTFMTRIHRYRREAREGTAYSFFVFDRSEKLLGGLTLAHMRRGVSHSAEIGYWIGERFAGRGYMTDALEALCQHCFTTLRLHRLQAACIPANEPSRRLLERCAFEREGLLRSYLFINGAWRDHYLYSRIAPCSNECDFDQASA